MLRVSGGRGAGGALGGSGRVLAVSLHVDRKGVEELKIVVRENLMGHA